MASHTLTQLLASLRRRIPAATTDTALTDTVLTEFINAALRQVSTEHNWPWLLSSTDLSFTSGDSDVPVPTDFLAMDSIVELSTGDALRTQDRKTLLYTPTTSTGKPAYYAIYANLVTVRPVPDASYTFKAFFFKMEPELTTGTDTPLIPKGYDEGVIEYASYLALRFKREEQRAQFAEKSYQNWVKRTSDNAIESRETRGPRIRPGSQV